ncbi:tumor necrosis factor receptor superfamily member 6 [Morone saxatilis]|uniref:tumor necrosis factor receptor superfamily member 6 n=1 Tax=Morone saxatilis TaxID=34816 RepID=UPI0015E1CB73|nr:tumor necrosis factor receptor superfamily member 6 [Morone saxatilis]
MMAADADKMCLIALVLFFLLTSGAFSPASGQCTDGTYNYKGKDCCRCGAGWHVVKHCNASLQRGECKECDHETYNSDPNGQTSCEPCTSCSHGNDNLEVVEPCTPARDTKCGCKEGHYCNTPEEICRLCQACETCGGPENIKEPCTNRTNTVCKEKSEGGNISIPGIIVGVIIAIVVVVAVVFIWKKRPFSRQRQGQVPNGNTHDVEMQPLYEVDLQPRLPDIAEALGWKDMKEVAIRSNIPMTVIDSCQLDIPGDSKEQTLKLLLNWVESQGSDAAKNLLEILQRSGKRRKAERVKEILSHDY